MATTAATVQVVANHLVYHTPGKPPAMPGTLVELAEAEAQRLLGTGAVRRPGDPARSTQTVTRLTGPQAAPPPPGPGAEMLPVPPPTPTPTLKTGA